MYGVSVYDTNSLNFRDVAMIFNATIITYTTEFDATVAEPEPSLLKQN